MVKGHPKRYTNINLENKRERIRGRKRDRKGWKESAKKRG